MNKYMPTASFTIGVIVWLLSIVGMIYITYIFQPVKSHDPLSVIPPRVFGLMLLILFGATTTGVGFLIGLIGLRVSGRKKFSWLAISINGLYCLPIAAMFLVRVVK